MTDYSSYDSVSARLDELGVLTLTLDRPQKANALSKELHGQLGNLWEQVSSDDDVSAVIITGAGSAFCAGGDLSIAEDVRSRGLPGALEVMEDARRLLYGMPECSKPIISAINGVAVGAGLAIALMADISIASDDALLMDGHTRLGVAAGDHANLIWPLNMSFAKAKYYLLTSEFITGREAADMGLVSKSVPAADLQDEAYRVAALLAQGSQSAIALTKRALAQWARQVSPLFEVSLAYEMLTMFGDDVAEGIAAIRAKRAPDFVNLRPAREKRT